MHTNDTENPCRVAALVCAKSFLAVIPCWWATNGICQCRKGRRCPSPAKHPLIEHWQDAATNQRDVIDGWWRKWPDANIGVACGTSGILVMDIDTKRGGEETFADLMAQHGPLPRTVEAITGSGGRHIYFASPGGISNHSPLDGVDIRGDGGFVIAPGSVHVSGREYAWEVSSHPADTPIAPAPKWLLDTLRQPTPLHPRASSIAERITEGGRHRALLSIAGSLRRRGATADEVFDCLRVFNRRCDPPLDDSDLRTLARSMERYAVGDMPLDALPRSGRYSLREGR